MNPGGGSGREEPPLDIQVPDDARELARDVLAYHREQRARRRRNRLQKLAAPFNGRGTIMPLVASVLAVCLVAGAMLSVATFGPSTAPGTRPAASATTSRSATASSNTASTSTASTSPTAPSPSGEASRRPAGQRRARRLRRGRGPAHRGRRTRQPERRHRPGSRAQSRPELPERLGLGLPECLGLRLPDGLGRDSLTAWAWVSLTGCRPRVTSWSRARYDSSDPWE